MWHKDLLGLGADDHPQYPLGLGRAGGQTLIGGTASGEPLTLQSTAHVTRGYVRAQDDLQLLSGVLRDPSNNPSITIQAATPNVALFNYTRLGDYAAIGVNPAAGVGLRVQPAFSGASTFSVISGSPTAYRTSGNAPVYGFKMMATTLISAGASASLIAGLYFTAVAGGAGAAPSLDATWVRTGLMSYSGPANNLTGLRVRSPMLMFSTYPTAVYGIDIENQGFYGAGTHNAIGLRIADQTATSGTKYLIEAGPATPYLRLVGGAVPGAGLSNLWVNFAGVLKQIQEDAANTAGAGFRRLRVVN